VVLVLRHGQCCHEGEHDGLKELTWHGQQQADATARYIKAMVDAGKVPQPCGLLHSTSRRARETAAKLPQHFDGIAQWNADLLRETDPTANPLRAEEVFKRLFTPPPVGSSETLIVVAHNNIILYLLMRVAGVPVDRAAQSWQLFQLRHASVTRVDVSSSGSKQVVSVGAAGHIPDACMTWNNVKGADMAAWKGGVPERRKLSGRVVVMVRQEAADPVFHREQIDAVVGHVKGLTESMVSGNLTVRCVPGAERIAAAVAQQFRLRPRLFPDSTIDEPEAIFLELFCAPVRHSRDTVIMVAGDAIILYCLFRALHMSPDEAKAAIYSYCIGHVSITIVNVRADSSNKVVTVGDIGHLPITCI